MEILNTCNNLLSSLEKTPIDATFEANGCLFKVFSSDDESVFQYEVLGEAEKNGKKIIMTKIDDNDSYSYILTLNDFKIDSLDVLPVSSSKNIVTEKTAGHYLYEVTIFLSSINENVIDDKNGIEYGVSQNDNLLTSEFGVIKSGNKFLVLTKPAIINKQEKLERPDYITDEYIFEIRQKIEIANSGMFGGSPDPDDVKFLNKIDSYNVYNLQNKTTRKCKDIEYQLTTMLMYCNPMECGQIISKLLSNSFLKKGYLSKLQDLKVLFIKFVDKIKSKVCEPSQAPTTFMYRIVSNYVSNINPEEGTLTTEFFNNFIKSLDYIELSTVGIEVTFDKKKIQGSLIFDNSLLVPYFFGETQTVVKEQEKTQSQSSVKKKQVATNKEDRKADREAEKLEKSIAQKNSKYSAYDKYEDSFF